MWKTNLEQNTGISGNSGTELKGLPLTKGEAIDEENTNNGLEDKYV